MTKQYIINNKIAKSNLGSGHIATPWADPLIVTAHIQQYLSGCANTHAHLIHHHPSWISLAHIHGVPIKNNPLEKMLYFSHGSMDLSQTFRLFM